MKYTIPKQIPQDIFRAYDIRGIVDESLTPDTVYAIGLAIGAEAEACGQKQLVVARDGRLSGPTLVAALIQGLRDSGRHLIDIGVVPTPVLYFATHWLKTHSGVMLTGSHNPVNYNGLKIVLNNETLSEDKIQQLYQRVVQGDFIWGDGTVEHKNIVSDYIERIASDVHLSRPMKIVIDAGNGVAGGIAPLLFKRLGCEVIELFCDVNGHFPNHHPDPSVIENLQDIQQAVLAHKADVGLAFDGDGDRLGVVTDQGKVIWPDRQMMLFAQDVLSRHKGAEIIFDVKSTQHLPKVIEKAGGKPLMWKTGHSLLKAKMHERGAPLAGEMSGHIFFKERWYGFDDGLYVGARLLEILSRNTESSSVVFNALPDSVNTPELKLFLKEAEKAPFMQKFIETAHFENGTINTLDGLRVDFTDGWGLVRLSNTTPCLTLRFEGVNEDSLRRIEALFREKLLAVDNQLQLPF
ncbi:MAG TPA: phosphomannomutase/phosphoglucomutase [Gammaproteobacteria bacterium]|nr:phosphomannomutase/phosphoglucomutase [Gammaproteobacteria bacterium]